MFFNFYMYVVRQKLKTHCNFDYNNKSESIYKKFAKIYIKFQQMKMKIYTTITNLEFSMSFANLFIGFLVQRFFVFSSKVVRSPTSYNMSSWAYFQDF